MNRRLTTIGSLCPCVHGSVSYSEYPAGQVGFEPTTVTLTGCCTAIVLLPIVLLARLVGLEPTLFRLEGGCLNPLDYRRKVT
jgi:hypothetical protein